MKIQKTVFLTRLGHMSQDAIDRHAALPEGDACPGVPPALRLRARASNPVDDPDRRAEGLEGPRAKDEFDPLG